MTTSRGATSSTSRCGRPAVTFVLSLFIWVNFDNADPDFQMVEQAEWLGGGINYHMGVDGISMLFVILTTFLMPLCIIASRLTVKHQFKEYMVAFLVMETLMIGVFCSLDLVLFYVFFEGGLIPMFLIIGIWGGPRRVYASFKFFLYTLLGSVLMLLAIMAMYWYSGTVVPCDAAAGGIAATCPTTDIVKLLDVQFPASMQFWLWIAFFASFAVKMPMWPVHTWLPDAHVEAPTAGSVILAAVLLKMGGYGFLRFSLPMFPLASADLAPFIFTLSVVAIIYTSLVALMQKDMKKLIAYSSVAHMGFVTMGIFAMTTQGVQGGIFLMLSHGLVSGALFLCVGVVYDRMHTREIAAYGGLVNRMPLYAAAFLIFTMANVGLPGTSGLRRRVPDPGRHLPGQYLGGLPRHHRHHPVGGLCAVALPAGDLRQAREGQPQGHPRPVAAGAADPRPAGRPDAAVRLLSRADHERDGGVGRPTGLQLSGGAVRGRQARGGCAMTGTRGEVEPMMLPDLLPALPEIMLAVGALVLLMIGVFVGERSTPLITGLSIALLVVAGDRPRRPAGRRDHLQRRLRARSRSRGS